MTVVAPAAAVSTNGPDAPDEIGFYSPSQVEELTTLRRQTLWRFTRVNKFPAPVVLTAGRVGYPRAAVNAWLRAKEHGDDTKLSRIPPRPKAGRKDAHKHDEAA